MRWGGLQTCPLILIHCEWSSSSNELILAQGQPGSTALRKCLISQSLHRLLNIGPDQIQKGTCTFLVSVPCLLELCAFPWGHCCMLAFSSSSLHGWKRNGRVSYQGSLECLWRRAGNLHFDVWGIVMVTWAPVFVAPCPWLLMTKRF